MPAPVLPFHSFLNRQSLGNRVVSIMLALATTVLIALLMLAMGALVPGDNPTVGRLVAVQIAPESASKVAHSHPATHHAAAPRSLRVPVPHPRVVTPPVAVTPFLKLSRQEFAASDISKLPRAGPDSGDGTSGKGPATYGPGDGPGGAHLYNAEWYREPSDAELGPYMSHANAPGEWATIACRMMEHYHVENCQELDESPPGSGLARALRLAAWQFLVRPPRVDGHVLIGSWVRIRFTFTRHRDSDTGGDTAGADYGR